MDINDELKIENFFSFFEYIKCKRKYFREFINEIGTLSIDNGYGTYFIKPDSKFYRSIVLNVEEDTLKSIDLIGDFKFSFNDINEKYGQYREAYSFRDDMCFYYFNELTNEDFIIELNFDSKIDLGKEFNLEQIKFIFK